MQKGIIYIKPNQCPKCLHELRLVNVETEVTRLDSYGSPILSSDTIDPEYEGYLYCTHCKSTYDAEKVGNHYMIKRTLPNIPIVIKDWNPFMK